MATRRTTAAKRQDAADNVRAIVRADGWINTITALGTSKDARGAAYFKPKEYAQADIDNLYRGSALFARIVDKIPEHATRRWITVSASQSDADFGRSVLDALEEIKARRRFYEWLQIDRLYGGAVMVIGANDGQDPATELDRTKIKSVDFLNALSRWEITPTEWDQDPTSATYLQPLMFRPNYGQARGIHRSRVLYLPGIGSRRDVFHRQWGAPLIERVYEDIRRFDTAYDYAEAGLKDLSMGVMALTGLPELLSQDEGNEILIRRLSLAAQTSSTFNAMLIDKDQESFERRTIGQGPWNEILLRIMDRMAAVSEIPLSVLFGQPPAGLSSDDASGRRTFANSVAAQQEDKMRDALNYLVGIMLVAKEGPTEGEEPEQWSIAFNPIDEPTEEETIDQRRTSAETDAILVQTQVITPDEARTRLLSDPESPYVLAEDEAPSKEQTLFPPGIIIETVKAISADIRSGAIERPFGVSLAAKALNIPIEEAEALFESVATDPVTTAAREAELAAAIAEAEAKANAAEGGEAT